MPDFPELPAVHELTEEDDERREQRFTRVVAVAIVLATLAAAVTAYLQASALRLHDEAGSRASSLAISASASRSLAEQAGQLLVDRYDLAQQQLARAAVDQEQAFFGPAIDQSALGADRTRRLAVAAQLQRSTGQIAAAYGLPVITAGSASSPEQDRFFPERYLAGARREAYRLGALEDAANQQGDEADSQNGRYAISLTVFAVAVFLFGYSLTPHARRHRRLFAGTAMAFVLGASVWDVATAARSPSLPPPRAAEDFAAGRTAYDSEQYPLAVRRLTLSLRAWPDYAQGHAVRALAEFAQGSPQLDIPLSLTRPADLAAATQDEQQAIDLGDEDSGLVVNHGFHLFALGLQRGDDGTIEQGLGFSRQGEADRPTDPVPAFNAGVALLTLGRLSQSRSAYREAVLRTVYADRRHHVERNDVAAYEFYLGEALTDLDAVAARRPALAALVRATKLQIVSPITRAAYAESVTGAVHQRASAGGLGLQVGPAFTQFTISTPHQIGNNADLSAQWYFDAPHGLGWSVLPDVSGALNGNLVASSGGSLVDRESFLSATGSCLSPGRYRLELYVNGRLVAVDSAAFSFPALTAARLLALRVDACTPSNWSPLGGTAPGLAAGYRSRDRRAGLLVFSISRQVVGAARPSPALSRRVLATALARYAPLLPTGLGGGGRDVPLPFLDLGNPVVRRLSYPGGAALAGAGAAAGSDQLLVAVVYGPQAFMSGLGPAIFSSLAREP